MGTERARERREIRRVKEGILRKEREYRKFKGREKERERERERERKRG